MTPETRYQGFPCIKYWGPQKEGRCVFLNPTGPQQPEQINKHCLCLNEVSDLHQNQRSFKELYWGRLMAHTQPGALVRWVACKTAGLCISLLDQCALNTQMPATAEKDTKLYCGCAFKLMSAHYPSASLLPISTLKIACKYLRNMFAIKRRKYYTLKSGRDFRLNARR